MESIKYVKTLREQVLNLINELSFVIKNDGGVLANLGLFFEHYPAHELMQSVIQYVLPWEYQIKTRNDDFFYKNKKIFGELPEEHINFFSDLWKSPNLDKDDKQMIWKYFDIFVACAQGHKKMQ